MRSQLVSVGTNVIDLLKPNTERKMVMLRNKDAAIIVRVQWGPSQGSPTDFWPLLPGEVLTIDPHMGLLDMIQGQWWLVADSGTPLVYMAAG